ncbi:MAG: 3-oxoacyl-[acyl-carrier-protein] synthase 2 [Holosporales bacterium]
MKKAYLVDVGIGCSLGKNKQEIWKKLCHSGADVCQKNVHLLSGRSAVEMVLPFDLPCVPNVDYNSLNNALGFVLLDQIKDSIEKAIAQYGYSRVGCVMGTSSSGMKEGEENYFCMKEKGFWPKEYAYSLQEISSLSDFIQSLFKLEGPCYTISTACSSSAKALAAAKRLIDTDFCDAVVVGGVDTMCELIRNGFDSLELLSPTRSIPFSKNRKGITLGTGGAIFLMCKDDLNYKNAPYLSGFGETSDASHISAPDPSGLQPEKSILKALYMARINATDISYVNLHGTGSVLNDNMEGACMRRILGQTKMSSTKGLTGHTLGGCGALEASFLWLALQHIKDKKMTIPVHYFDGEQDAFPLELVKDNDYIAIENKSIHLLSVNFAFGGSNTALIISRD